MVRARYGNLLAADDPGGDVFRAASHHRVLLVPNDHCGRRPDLAEPGAGGRVRLLVITEPEKGGHRPADLSSRGWVSTGGCPSAQAEADEPIPVPGLVEPPASPEPHRA